MSVTQLSSNKRANTAYLQVIHGRDQEAGMYPVAYWLSFAYGFGDLTASLVAIAHVPPNGKVLRVVHEVVTAFTGATDIQVGDGSTQDGWIGTGTITLGTPGDCVGDPDSTYHALGCKRYGDGDTIDVYVAGPVSAGSGKVYVEVLGYFENLTDN